jgi:hypothetical protein
LKKLSVKMSDVVKEMTHQVPHCFFRFHILLAANVTITPDHSSSAVQAVLFVALPRVAHNKFLLKISTKIQAPICFSLLNNSVIFDDKRIPALMKNIFVAFFAIIFSVSLHAQYYYQDIIGTRDLNQMVQLYLKNKVASVEATGYDADGSRNDDFSETHNFFADRNLLKISTRNKTDISNEYYRFNSKGLVTTISDTSSSVVSTTTYIYDNNDHPVIIKNIVNDANDSIYANEVHQWFYNADGKPTRMLRIVNNNDTTDVRFTIGDKGNVVDELPFIKRISREKTYYYYDDKNRLTDIVRFNVKANRLLPDYMFDYSDQDQVIKKRTTISAADVGYLIWEYGYDEKGLKIREASYDRNKQMTGKIQYSYWFGE